MEALIYILKSTAILSLFLLVYEIFLKRETFFAENRWFLLLGIITSIILPAITFKRTVYVQASAITSNLQMIPEGVIAHNPVEVSENSSLISEPGIFQILLTAYVFVVMVLIIRFLVQLLQLRNILKNQKTVFHQDGVRFIETTEKTGPFSFFKTIVYNPSLYEQEELDFILRHELAHVRNYHNIDIVLANLFTLFNWFNPLAWLYRKRISENLEFLADKEATVGMESLQNYQMSLLNAAFPNYAALPVINFHQSFLKTRIMKLNQKQSKKTALFKLSFIIPLLLIFFGSCQLETNEVYAQDLEFNNDGTSLIADDNGFKGAILATTSAASLEKMKSYLKEHYQATIKYHDIKRNDKNQITEITFTFQTKDGYEAEKTYTGKNGKPIMGLAFGRLYNDPEREFYLETLEEIMDSESIKDITHYETEEIPFQLIDQVPLFPGCEELETNAQRKECMSNGINAFVNKNFDTGMVKRDSITGLQRINVQFTVNENGVVDSIKARARYASLEEEAKRVVELLPQMQPGKKDDQAVRVIYQLPIVFQIQPKEE